MDADHSPESFVAAADELARQRSAAADYARQLVRHRVIETLRSRRLKDAEIGRLLGLSRTQVTRSGPPPERPSDQEIMRAGQAQARAALEDASPWIVEVRDPTSTVWPSLISETIMQAHGIEPRPGVTRGRADEQGRSWLHKPSGRRVLMYTHSRWCGMPTDDERDGDFRGEWILEECPGLTEEGCVGPHQPISLSALGLRDGAQRFGTGWPEPRPEINDSRAKVSQAIKASYGIIDLYDFELEEFDL